MKDKLVYSELANLICARANCAKSNNSEWHEKHTNRITEIVAKYMPTGSGFDNGTHLDLDASTENKLVFTTAYHHMNESGMYDGWTDHTVTVTPAFVGNFDIRISGRNRNDIKEYMHDTFSGALTSTID